MTGRARSGSADQCKRGAGLWRAPILHPYGGDSRSPLCAPSAVAGESGDLRDRVSGGRRYGSVLYQRRGWDFGRRVDCTPFDTGVAGLTGVGCAGLSLDSAAEE